MRKTVALLLFLAILGVAGFVCIRYYSFVFSKSIQGEIIKVERVNQGTAIIAGQPNVPASQLFSFAVAVRDKEGAIHTASSEDRQWAVAQPGQCALVRFFPYPPWDLDKAGTYFNARLLQLSDCPKK